MENYQEGISRKLNKQQIFDGKDFQKFDAYNADSVGFIFFRINGNMMEAQFVVTGNKEDISEEMWTPITDMSVTTIDVIRKKLQNLIQDCYFLVQSSTIGDELGQFKEQSASIFTTQIKNAENILNDPTSTINALDAAFKLLTLNKRTFELSKITVVSQVKDRLLTLILMSEELYLASASQTAESKTGFYDPDDRRIFKIQIDAARLVYDDQSAIERQVNQSYKILNDYYEYFRDSIYSNVDTDMLKVAVDLGKIEYADSTDIPAFTEYK